MLPKICLVGDASVGKSSLILRLINDRTSSSYITTISSTRHKKTLLLEEKAVEVQVWDTPGMERFRENVSHYIKGSHAVMLVFDLTNAESFSNLAIWVEKIKKCESTTLKIILVGNKSDLFQNRQVDQQIINDFVEDEENGISTYIEVSAEVGTSVEHIFLEIVREIFGFSASSLVASSEHKSLLSGENRSSECASPSPETSLVTREELSATNSPNLKIILMLRLEKYLARMDESLEAARQGAKSKDLDFSHGFWFFKASRAIGRKANYYFARRLLGQLAESDGSEQAIVDIFSKLDEKRVALIEELHLLNNEAVGCQVDLGVLGIQSGELNEIVEIANFSTNFR